MPNPPITLTCVAGRTATFARQTPNADGSYGGLYAGSEAITATVWPEDSEVAVLTQSGLPNGWIDAAATIWAVTFVDAQTAALTPGVYRMEVTSPPSGTTGETGVLFQGLLEVVSSAGSTVPSNLASAVYVGKALTRINLAPGEWEYLPDCLAAASDLIRKYCNRAFTQGQYVETLPVINGQVLLSQAPVNMVLRAQASPRQALAAGNNSAVASWITATFTGDATGSTGGPAITGLALNWLPGGPAGGQAVPFTAGMTIAQLATAIAAVGNGWNATADSTYGALPVTELIDLAGGSGAAPGDPSYGGATYRVYGEDVAITPVSDQGQKTGMYRVGRARGGYGDWGRAGYGWGDGGAYGDAGAGDGRIRVTYDGGFAIVPAAIQAATAELVKANFERLRTDAYLASESAGEYSYQIAVELIGNLPGAVRQTLSLYATRNA